MDTYLRKMIGRYPEREFEILKLYRDSQVFRSICEEMEMADAAQTRWKDVPERALEYRQILGRLEHEFWEHLSSGTRQRAPVDTPDADWAGKRG